uniref:Uncharacterized protein n=1 Tax=Aegilops tauschii subsp. strangulata TaxID=200361 RepID=A0A453KTI8_AEGTS
ILSTFCMLRNAPNLEELDIMANRVHFWACADDIHVARLCKMLSFSSPPFGSLEQNRNIGSRSVTSIPDSRGGS